MISLLIVAHGNLGECLIGCATHIQGVRPPALDSLDLTACEDPTVMLSRTEDLIRQLDTGDGVLILTDLYGSTPCNAVCKAIRMDGVQAVAGVNLPMLLKCLTYRDQRMDVLLTKAVSGGQAGIFAVAGEDASKSPSQREASDA
jgi:PTS system ascorbate-specific IIA component